mmetsp:Transcript_50339/g.130718  ORF Transcript_50339/g.130718 Transcript_50339/m.130718 type:complete len:212 (-) Transcript_50339:68-703(-)
MKPIRVVHLARQPPPSLHAPVLDSEGCPLAVAIPGVAHLLGLLDRGVDCDLIVRTMFLVEAIASHQLSLINPLVLLEQLLRRGCDVAVRQAFLDHAVQMVPRPFVAPGPRIRVAVGGRDARSDVLCRGVLVAAELVRAEHRVFLAVRGAREGRQPLGQPLIVGVVECHVVRYRLVGSRAGRNVRLLDAVDTKETLCQLNRVVGLSLRVATQ